MFQVCLVNSFLDKTELENSPKVEEFDRQARGQIDETTYYKVRKFDF